MVVDELIRCGVTDVILAPGSRSAPLAMALARAEARGELVLHVRIDERSAAYLALGLGKVSGVPAAVITTSGTAAVNLHPAIVEAHESDIPLLAITADRPPMLRGVGANQSIDQAGVFGAMTRLAIDMATATAWAHDPQAVAQHNRYWRSTVARAVATATDASAPGPVHLNMPFADPLVPDADDDPVGIPRGFEGRADGRPWTADLRILAGVSGPLDETLQTLTGDGQVPARGLIVVGDHADPEAVELVDELGDVMGWPVIGEPSGNVAGADTALSHGALLLADADFAGDHLADLVITVGRVGLARPIARHIARSGLHLHVDGRSQWSDAGRSADAVLAQVPMPPSDAVSDPSWLAAWQRADLLAAAAVETALAGEGPVCTGMHVARAVAAGVPQDGMLFLGASWPVRHVLSFAASAPAQVVVLGNRGTSGIDGCVSTAWGAAIAWQRNDGGPAVALIGDLTLRYDVNGLRSAIGEPQPDLVYVVVDNDGGGIFSQLEQGQVAHADVFERVFGTPPTDDVAAVASAAGLPVTVVEDVDGLQQALPASLEAGGVSVLVVRTCEREQEARILAGVQRAVGEALGSA